MCILREVSTHEGNLLEVGMEKSERREKNLCVHVIVIEPRNGRGEF